MKPAVLSVVAVITVGVCVALVIVATTRHDPISLDVPPSQTDAVQATPPCDTSSIRATLMTGSPAEKSEALNLVRDLLAIRFMHDVIELIDDPSPLPREGDTGWGFLGHQAATVAGELAFAVDRVRVEDRGTSAYSFHDDMYLGSEKLGEAGRLIEVRDTWRTWWQNHINR